MDFTPEQEAEIQRRIDEAQQKQKALEQYRIAGDQFYRMAISSLAPLVSNGTVSEFVMNVGKQQYMDFLANYFPQAPAPEQEQKGADDGTQTD